ncbi:EamA family transporter [Parvibacter caecicola]|uniref:EamA family transporter n=1 Tax=Parvibacter caecicola TaxID=747645 RepID=UPI001F21D25C|nr:DMT family transporter [Parvibacter caecicola]MCR2041319.1 DMT family transporter [Parvibacter caecicola]
MERGRFLRGCLLSLSGAALWGLSGACAQMLFTDYGAIPAFVTGFRTLATGLLFLALILVRSRHKLKQLLAAPRDMGWFALFGLGLFGSQFFFAFSVAATDAGTACVLQMLNSVFVLAFVCAATCKAPTLREGAGLALALAATVLIATQGSFSSLAISPAGLGWGLANALAVAVYIVVPRQVGLFQRYGSLFSVGIAMLLAALPANGAMAVQAAADPSVFGCVAAFDGRAWLVLVAGVTLLGTFAAFALYLTGIAKAGSVAGSLLGAAEPVSASAIAALWLGTAFTGWDWGGLALMLAMLACMTV